MNEERQFIYQARQAVYGLLGRLYQEPLTPTLHDWLKSERPFSDFPVTFEDGAVEHLQQVDGASQEVAYDDLRQDYIQLYIGPGNMKVPPWESVYRNEDRSLFDSHTLQVRQTYARHGMEFVKKNKTPEDHLAIELEFMRILNERLLKTLENDDEKAERILVEEQHAFLKDHILAWLPNFIRLSQEHALTPFYTGLAGVLGAFVQWDTNMVDRLLDVLPASAAE